MYAINLDKRKLGAGKIWVQSCIFGCGAVPKLQKMPCTPPHGVLRTQRADRPHCDDVIFAVLVRTQQVQTTDFCSWYSAATECFAKRHIINMFKI